jgi:hypothetical protein
MDHHVVRVGIFGFYLCIQNIFLTCTSIEIDENINILWCSLPIDSVVDSNKGQR